LGLAEKIAVKTLAKKARGKLKLCRDNIDFVINYIVRGYTYFDANRGTKLESYLIGRARYAVQNLFRKKRKQNRKFVKTYSIDKQLVSGENFCIKHLLSSNESSVEDKLICREIINYIKNSSYFVDRQKKILLAIFEDGRTIQDIANELNLHKSYAHLLFRTALDKLKWKFNENE
jgi:DNA-directed RNA polymerase specialized sigma subunit